MKLSLETQTYAKDFAKLLIIHEIAFRFCCGEDFNDYQFELDDASLKRAKKNGFGLPAYCDWRLDVS